MVSLSKKQTKALKKIFDVPVRSDVAWRDIEVEPNKPFSGNFTVRLDPDLHCDATIAARTSGMSLNAWVTEAIKKQSENHKHST